MFSANLISCHYQNQSTQERLVDRVDYTDVFLGHLELVSFCSYVQKSALTRFLRLRIKVRRRFRIPHGGTGAQKMAPQAQTATSINGLRASRFV